MNSAKSGRRQLQEEPLTVPKMTIVKVKLPPQITEEEQTELVVNDIVTERDATIGLTFGIALFDAINVPSEII